MRQANPKLTVLARAVIEPLGYELVGVEHVAGRRDAIVRVFIDQEAGITVDDCALVSHQLSAQLDIDDPIPGQYALEVSSPGLDRPLFTIEQLRRFEGQRARVRLSEKQNGRRNFEGVLSGVVNADAKASGGHGSEDGDGREEAPRAGASRDAAGIESCVDVTTAEPPAGTSEPQLRLQLDDGATVLLPLAAIESARLVPVLYR